MRRVAVRSVVISAYGVSFAAVAFIACSSSGRPNAGGGGTDSGTYVGKDGGGPSDGSKGDGNASDADPCVNPGPSLCDPTSTFAGAPTAIPGITADVFGSITPDELHVSWVTGAADAGTVTVHVADRAAASAAFGADLSADLPVAFDRVALAADGMSAIAVTPDRRSMVSLTRGAGAPLGTPNSAAFAAVTATTEGGELRSPVLSADGSTFYIVLDNGSPDMGVSVFQLQQGFWQPIEALNSTALNNAGSSFRVPTGISFDNRTLFFIDEVGGGTEGAAFRAGPSCAFTQIVSLGARQGAAPNQACSTVYFQGSSTIETAGK